MRVKVHVEGIVKSRPIEEGEEPTALFHGLLEIDGQLLEEVSRIEVLFGGEEFVTVKPCLLPGSFEVVTHTDESWDELLNGSVSKEAARLRAVNEVMDA